MRDSLTRNADSVFEVESLKVDIKKRSIRGGVITIAAQGAKFFLQIMSAAILGRLLTPNDFGLVAMVTVVTGVILLLKDVGLSMATVQKEDINHSQISTLFWVNVIAGIGIMLLTSVIAPTIALFYNEPRLVRITLVLAIVYVFSGLTVQHQALLRRQMRFGRLALIEILSMLGGIIAAVISALYGAGYWALILMQIVTAIVSMIGVWIACGWRPGLPKRNSGVRPMLAFGSHFMGFNIVNYFARNLDSILIGRYWGAQPLGLYAQAYKLLTLPLQQINAPISGVTIPVLSRLQNEPERYRRYYIQAISLIALVTMPMIMFMIIMSKDVIRIVLGEQWVQAGAIFAVLGISGLIQPVINANGWLYVSVGRTDRMFKWGIFSSVFTVLSFFIGLPYGAIGVATSYTVVTLLLAFPCLWYAFRFSPVDILSVAKALWPTVAATLIVGVALIFFKTMFPVLFAGVWGVVIGFGITVGVFLSVLCGLVQSLKPIQEIIALLSQIFPQKNLHKKDVN